MILYDLHTHVLPNMDDGAKDVTESLAMLKTAYAHGVRVCAATPHCIIHRSGRIESFLEKRQDRYEMLKSAMDASGEPLPEIILGAEVYMDHDISQHRDIKKLCYEGTDYMLVELTDGIGVSHYVEWLYSLNLLGIKPLLAHVHRYAKALDLIAELDGMDVLYQLNTAPFLSFKGRRRIMKLLDTGETFIVSSDMHNTSSRPPDIDKAYKKSLKSYPRSTEALFSINAEEMLKVPQTT